MNKKEHMFLKIWLRIGVPILTVTIIVLYFGTALLAGSLDILGYERIEINGTDLAMILSRENLSDRAALEKKLDLSQWRMVGIIFDSNGVEVARSDIDHYTEDDVLRSKYDEMVETLLKMQSEKSIVNNSIDPFGYNFYYETKPVFAKQGEYMLYYAGVTSTWIKNHSRLTAIIWVIFAAMTVLTLLIALSYYKIHRKQQAMEAAYSQKVNALAHTLKTPMMVVSGYSENFLAQVQTEKNTYYAEKILENVNKMNTIVEEMLAFTR